MNTPIVDFVKRYCESDAMRCHMPGHKGLPFLGYEHADITEFHGADSLYDADGIIRESEENASGLFECRTLYSTEGSSQCIRAMLYLIALHAKNTDRPPRILATRNAHKVFVGAAALLNIDIAWYVGDTSYLSCNINPNVLEEHIIRTSPTAVYLTSPDYLGQLVDIRTIAAICRKHNVLLAVDNAHGAYLKFLSPSAHPIDLGADLCCDSAHKTLPALTGAAYLHIADSAPTVCHTSAKQALALFGSTSPSYLILQSLDLLNAYLANGYVQTVSAFIDAVDSFKATLTAVGYVLTAQEPLKVTVAAKPYGYTGIDLAKQLEAQNIICEFYDPDYTVLMLTPENGDLGRLRKALLSIPRKTPLPTAPPLPEMPERVMSAHEALLSPNETVDIEHAEGRILADITVGCPPAVPIVMCGERISKKAVSAFRYYGITSCTVVKG